MDQILIGLTSPNMKPLEWRACPTGWKLAGQAQGLLVCVEKTKNFDQIEQPQLWWQKWSKILIGSISPNLKPLE